MKSIKFKFTQSATNDPQVIELQNDFSIPIKWKRDSSGNYFGRLGGAFPDKTKCFFAPSTTVLFNDNDDMVYVRFYWEDANTIGIYCTDNGLGAIDLECVNYPLCLELTVFN